jgi:hypothetical protein
MPRRIRQCVECPKCHVRYLIGWSPYHNGSYLLSHPSLDQIRLYCACDDSPSCYAFRWNELKTYAVSDWAYERGYGSPDEIVMVGAANAKAS